MSNNSPALPGTTGKDFSKVDCNKKSQFLDEAKAAREERALEKKRSDASLMIQKNIRAFLTREKLRKKIYEEFDTIFVIPKDGASSEYRPEMNTALLVFQTIKKFHYIHHPKRDAERYHYLCRYILISMDSDIMKNNYASMALSKVHMLDWIQQIKQILCYSSKQLSSLRPDMPRDMKMITTFLHMIVTFTSINTWKIIKGAAGEVIKPGLVQLCSNIMRTLNGQGLYLSLQMLLTKSLARSNPVIKHATLSAIITISLRPVIAANFSDNLMSVFLLHIMSVPAVVYHVSTIAQECLSLLVTHRIFKRSIDLLSNEQATRIIFNTLEGNYALCLLANLIQLGDSELEGLVENCQLFIKVMIRLLDSCKKYVICKKSNLTHWHPVLGWFSQSTDISLHESMPYVTKQLQLLWRLKMIKIMFSDLIAAAESFTLEEEKPQLKNSQTSKNPFKRAIEKAQNKEQPIKLKPDSPLVIATCLSCSLYQTALDTLTQLQMDILAGLSYGDFLLPILWKFMNMMGPNCGLRNYLDLISHSPVGNDTSHPLFNMLTLFADTATHLIIILDDIEMYENGKPFSVDSLKHLSKFLNTLIYKIIWHNLLDTSIASENPFFSSVHSLLMILYARDCRRSFAPPNHWLVNDVKPSFFNMELEHGQKPALFLLQKTPHVLPHKERVLLFRKNVQREKEMLGVTDTNSSSRRSTLIMIHRSRLIEDGYRQLAQLPPKALKGVIRVKFINLQGLDEAGIDQDGVFKEFLEETIKEVFDPALNIFKVTSENKLYPSPTAHIQENYLQLFEFIGRMLGKAVYEGIIVEVPFASFFLSHMLGYHYCSTYSSIDELPSLDPELYKSLTFVKHYEGDVSDLDLTFSCDEDFLGKIVTHELVPGGKAIPVNNDNKISYVHHMAHFRMYVQLKEQTQAFIRGFMSIVNPDWLCMFSAPELQKLISGDTADLDLDDLRRNTQYYGGFHNNHRVINWLWDILSNDFTPAERGLFLKFVTSCSKPPLLGFANLEPPFCIRCVEVADDLDTGDTVGSVLKGFFNIKRKDPVGRLPTSSTCFNLLKLPNYQKKATLRDKLRYAITSNTGFELS